MSLMGRVNFWSKGEVKANFLRHEGYLGAIGAFLKGCQSIPMHALSADSYSWTENLFGSSSSFPVFGSAKDESNAASVATKQDIQPLESQSQQPPQQPPPGGSSSRSSSLTPSSSSMSLIEVRQLTPLFY